MKSRQEADLLTLGKSQVPIAQGFPCLFNSLSHQNYQMNKATYSLICCVWNEINRAPAQLSNLVEVLLNTHNPAAYEIILIDNYSTDGTREWIENLVQSGVSVVKVFNSKNIGKGGSIRKGIQLASGSYSAIFDLDGEYSAHDIFEGFNLIKSSGAAICLASRTLDGRSDYVYFQNYLGVRLLSELINALYNIKITDSATGLKILDNRFYQYYPPRHNGFNVDFELICIALNQRRSVAEYNGDYFPRSKSEGKKIQAFKDGFESLVAIVLTSLRGIGVFHALTNIISYTVSRSAIRYFFVGFVSTVVDVLVFMLLYASLGFSVLTANLCAFICALAVNYLLGISIVFVKNARFSTKTELLLVALTSLATLAMNTLLVYMMISLSMDSSLAKIVAVVPTFLSNYLFRRLYIYRRITHL